jgi:hypothetical protein
MKVLNFNELAISRFRSILFDAALNSSIQEMLVDMTGSVATRLGLRSAVEFEYGPEVARLENASARDRAIEQAKHRALAKQEFRAQMNLGQKNGLIISYEPNSNKSWEMAGIASFVGVYWSGNRVSRVIVKSEDGRSVSLGRSNSAPPAPGFHQDLGGPLAIGTISTIELEYDAADTDVRQDITLVFRLGERNAENFELRLQFVLPAGRRTRIPLRKSTAVLLSFSSNMVAQELINHLNENALYYSQQVWLNSDPSLLALQLAPFTFKNKRVIEYIDPAPVAAAANFIAFRWKDEDDEEWTTWVQDNIDKASVDVDTVALPTGGVFAEAVLGRFNSAEKLDITRFWNWQDSPIPITAPEIAAIQAGQHVAAVQPTPGNLESPIVNIQTPPALPDPTGMQGVLQTLAASNLFRDMSGITQAAALAQSGLQNASQGAVAGMNQAGANMATFANFQVEMAKILASLAPMLLGLPPVAAPASKNISNAGAAINHGADMDTRRGGASSEPTRLPSGIGSSFSGSGSGGSGVGAQPANVSGGTIASDFRSSNEGAAFTAALPGGVTLALGQMLASAAPTSGSTPEKKSLTLGQQVPNKAETEAVGAISAKVVRGTPEFDALVKNENPDIEFKDEENTGADRMMTSNLKARLDKLAELVKQEWPGKKLRVTEAWDEDDEHAATSLHYEGRAVDITVSDKDNAKLGRLGQLAVDAGFGWVWYEDTSHVHASVEK